jgi:hypothetical protein
MVQVHGLAASIRAAKDNETFDLGGQTTATISSTIESAFAEPLDHLIRITFVTGAGKQARQKYDDGAAKAVIAALQKHGYQEDRAASCVMECSGTYKMQHDTGKNLKTVVVFPKVVSSAATESAEKSVSSLIPEDSPGHKLAVAAMPVFKNMIKSKCPSWSQKRGCLESIEALKGLVQGLDEKLMTGTPLTDSEQAFYDTVTRLDEKEAYVRQEAQKQVEEGNVTAPEKDVLLRHNAERIEALTKERKSTVKAVARRDMLESIDPKPPLRLSHQAEIGKLRKELAPLLQLEGDTKGRLLSVRETVSMSRKDEIVEEIEWLEEASRGWFEDDDAFATRVQASRDEFAVSQKRRKQATTTTASLDAKVKAPASNKWVTPGETRGWSGKKDKAKAKRSKGNVGLFDAMMMDSSDEEEEEEVVEREEQGVKQGETKTGSSNSDNVKPAAAASTSPAREKPRDKSKKKKKTGKPKVATEEEVLSPPEEDKQEKHAAAFVLEFLLSLVVALLGWLIGLLFGKRRKKKRS